MEHHADEHEEIHLPGPSIAPFITAAGMALSVAGLLSLPLLIVGLVVLAVGIALWVFIRD